MQVALRRLQEAAQQAAQADAIVQAKVDKYEARVSRAKGAYDATVAAEEATSSMTANTGQTMGAQLGVLLRKKGMKVSELIAKWGGGDGTIDRKEFITEVRGLGLSGPPKDMNALFDYLDGAPPSPCPRPLGRPRACIAPSSRLARTASCGHRGVLRVATLRGAQAN